MKILFLDIDGVVNKRENYNPSVDNTLYPIDSYCAFLVGRIQLQTGCEVVLSSSWRHHPEGIAEVEKHIVKILDKTPLVRSSHFRGDEIKAWLKENQGVNKYAILDDDIDFYPDQPLFKTTFEHGLTDEIANQVIEFLNQD